MLENAQAPLLIADAAYLKTAEELVARIDGTRPARRRNEAPRGLRAVASCARRGRSGRRRRPGDVIVQMYTSGTTGVPKGVLTTHRNLAAAATTSARWGFDADTISLTPLPLFHIGGIGWVYCGLWHGATTILVSEFDAAR